MKLLDLHHPWFRPVWRRGLVCAFCLVWGLFEMASGAVFWAVIFLGLAAICGYQFFVVNWEAEAEARAEPPE